MAGRKSRYLIAILVIVSGQFGAVLHAFELDFVKARKKMIQKDLMGRDISDPVVLKAMSTIPREKFVLPKDQYRAYSDHPLPIGEGQTISQPYIVALMTQLANLKGNERVLEIGTGSGYQAAVLAEIVPEVYTIEIRKPLAESAAKRLRELDYHNTRVKHADGYFGWKEAAPFDVIMITAAANHVPPPLKKQLADGGRLILPLGSTTYFQTLTLIEKKGKFFRTRQITGVVFVPMIGKARE
ncbi:MAG: protein-L-isoaspartate(D-aspartate) O-methyltransferase [Deltaproteobacteria bacterium]|nr:protein-L-isoaspartate(D-aspartate) O-methyltransferase [Deltaproteobacteria bacterium]MBW2305618.1 protein-L-isoaspartate(D-aspartate) O-methyltransferase [Deltaproteobacteria bacterium]